MEAFRINLAQLHSLYLLATSLERVVALAQDPDYSLTLDPYDPDKAGAYFQGNRCYLRDNEQIDLYIYFGAIFSYLKDPAGLFAEVDQFNNGKHYDQIRHRIEPDEKYVLSVKDTGFVKLFMTDADIARINNAVDSNEQDQIFAEFLRHCCRTLIQKARRQVAQA